jgi:hypothetical protein
LLRGLRVLDRRPPNAALEARVDTLHLAVARLADQTADIQVRVDDAVTKKELAEAVDRLFGPMERAVDVRFAHQARSVEALRVMVGQTDALLQRVLDGLESMNPAA